MSNKDEVSKDKSDNQADNKDGNLSKEELSKVSGGLGRSFWDFVNSLGGGRLGGGNRRLNDAPDVHR